MSYAEERPIIHLTDHQKKIYPWVQKNLRTPFWRCYWNVTAGGFLKIGEEKMMLRTDLIYIVPGYLHFSTFAEKPFEQYYIHFTPPEKYFIPGGGILTAPITEQWKRHWREWEMLGKSLKKDFFRRELLAETILAEALLAMPKEIMQTRLELSAVIKQAISMIVKDFASPPKNEILARECKMELRTFLRRFRTETGETPQQYSRRLRTEKACEYLSYTDMSIEEIAEKTGFPDRYYFSRVFYQLQNIPPATFRRIQKEQIYKQPHLTE
ncbi:MAG: helix-turn-helix transcriptional regulator [Lentisphaeria bacterium]|nr:helix-turn-helix transcriptional regulator [Lentisphaeria bacterium]MBQ9775251.1 helix-turn-helix transcriptional regulator [Lentisphaeria bacterium]